jgi:hypothetical protein
MELRWRMVVTPFVDSIVLNAYNFFHGKIDLEGNKCVYRGFWQFL